MTDLSAAHVTALIERLDAGDEAALAALITLDIHFAGALRERRLTSQEDELQVAIWQALRRHRTRLVDAIRARHAATLADEDRGVHFSCGIGWMPLIDRFFARAGVILEPQARLLRPGSGGGRLSASASGRPRCAQDGGAHRGHDRGGPAMSRQEKP